MPLVIPFPDIDPAIFTIELGGFAFSLRWYAMSYIVGLLIAWRLIVALMRRPQLWPENRAPMTTEQCEEIMTWMILGVVLGGRLGYVLFYDFPRFAENPLEIFKIWTGGMSFHGGILGVILATIFYTRSRSIPLFRAGDAVALATPAGLFLGRIANFINGELYGRPTDVPWAMQFPLARDDQGQVVQWTEPRHPSQLYEAALEGLLLFAIMWALALWGGWLKRPGALTGVFLIGYGSARFTVEFFRQWDPQLSEMVATYGITMGQALSLPMIGIGLVFLLAAFRRTRA